MPIPTRRRAITRPSAARCNTPTGQPSPSPRSPASASPSPTSSPPAPAHRSPQPSRRPLPPAELLSLAQSGAPVDLLFRLGVQSVNGLPNGATQDGQAQAASGGFLSLMQALRTIQAAGAVSLRFERGKAGPRVFLLLGDDRSPTGE